MTDQFEFVSRLIANKVPIPICDIDDLDYAVEREDFPHDTGMHYHQPAPYAGKRRGFGYIQPYLNKLLSYF
ncbi:MAG: hypothetical protein E6230_09175 [Paenibacillus dendritiformis]|uniref:hypothetical protein n=1 Tax=uncultured Paenibacillus sp. TaxID=227322 RepID=UPI0025F3AAE7|nr:hypothetical protein [uncultured Paenibacillus sp.]MDU5142345.1 hypothetical protein [Paenibacillus dendritiformis]